MTGTVYLIGAGPGAPDLLTLRAADLLRRADIVFHDALVHPDTLALAGGAEKIAVGKRCGRHSTAQRFINKRLVDAARKHDLVVRLKGGDPMLFGRAQEEIDELSAAGIRSEVVPGITAALAASAELGVSLTRRGVARSVVLTTPRVGTDEAANDWAAGIHAGNTAVVYMGAGKAGEVAEQRLSNGVARATPVVIVENATLPERREIWCTAATLPQAARQSVEGPALIIIGRVLDKAQHDALHAEPPDEQTDRFLEYGNSWFR
ncbi:MAG: uroporphyrinogen-III C-methyltransferase [Burkholderiales bacterium]|nr:uroporphyrinogen-III C-methyltransferase [Burkholderiales bacterium]